MLMCKGQSQICKGFFALLAVLTLLTGLAFSQRQSSSSHSMLASAKDLGPEDASKQITATVWLRQRNKNGFDALVQQMYQKGSPNYHKWLTMAQYKAKFAPTEQDAAAVRDFLAAHNLKVSSIEKNNHYVMATADGSATVQNAFNVQINRFNVKGAIRSVATSEASMSGAAGASVAAVQVGRADLCFECGPVQGS